MKNCFLKPLIEKVKNQDMSAFPIIYDQFKGFIYFYSVKLHYEDASQELTLFFIELLYNIKLSKFKSSEQDSIARYIVTSLKNKYITLNEKKIKSLKTDCKLYESKAVFYEDFLQDMLLNDSLNYLSDIDKKIIFYRYVYGYSIAEIADLMAISRQAVNKRKNRALSILREVFTKNEDFIL